MPIAAGSPENALPQAVADHHALMIAGHFLVRSDQAAVQRRDAEQRECVRRHPDAEHAFGAIGHAEVRRPVFGRAHLRERAVLLAPVVEVRGRDRSASAVQHHRQFVGILIGQRLQQNRLQRAEHRRIRADADGEDEDGAETERGRAAKRAQGVADVADQGLGVHSHWTWKLTTGWAVTSHFRSTGLTCDHLVTYRW